MRKLLKLLVYSALVIAFILGGAYVYLFPLGGTEKIINSRIDSLLRDKYHLDVSIGAIDGGIFSTLILRDVSIAYDDSLSGYRLAYIPRIEASYSLSEIVNGLYELDLLTIDSAQITVKKDSLGKPILPRKSVDPDGGVAKPTPLPPFFVRRMNLNGLSFHLLGEHDSLKIDDIHASLAIKGEENTFSVDIDRFEFITNQQKIGLSSAGGKVTLAEKRLLFKDIVLISSGLRLKLEGSVDLTSQPAGMVNFAADNVQLDEVSALFGPKLSGRVDVNGRVVFIGTALQGSLNVGGNFMKADIENLSIDFRYGDKQLTLDTLYGTVLDNCSIDGSGRVDFSSTPPKYALNADLKQFNLSSLVKESFKSNLNGRLAMEGESFRQKEMKLLLTAKLYESSFDEYPIQSAEGKFLVTADSIVFLDSFRVDYYENAFYASGTIEYKHNIDLRVDAELGNLERYVDKLFVEQPAGRGRAEVTIDGLTRDPNLRGTFYSDSLWLYRLYCDSALATFDVERFLTGKLGSVETFFYNGTAWDTPYDSGYARMQLDSSYVYVDTLYVSNQYGRAVSAGRYKYDVNPGFLTLDTLSLQLSGQSFYNQGAIAIAIDSSGFNFRTANIVSNGARLSAVGAFNYNQTLSLNLTLEALPIEPWQAFFAESLQVAGTMSCEATLKGTLREPKINLSAEIDSLTYKNLLLGEVTTSLRYDDKLLEIDSLVVFANPGIYRANGFLYIDLALTTDSLERFPDAPMEIKVTASDNRFDLVEVILPSVEELTGDLFADFVIFGSPEEPELEGTAYIRNGSLKYLDLENKLYSDSAGITMKNNRIYIDRIAAYVYNGDEEEREKFKEDKKRFAYIAGDITFLRIDSLYYNVTANIPRDLRITYSLDDITATVRGDFRVVGATPPLVTGDAKITSMEYNVNFAEPGEGSPIMLALASENTWDLDIDVEIPSKYWIRNTDIDAEFSGDLNIRRENGVYAFLGEMQVLRGKGFLFDRVFRLEEGGKVAFDGDEKFNPTLDIKGYTRISGVSDEENTNEQLLLGIHVTGTLEIPEINVTEDSDFGSREDILPLLLANYSGEPGSSGGAFGQRLTGLVSSQVSQIGARQLRRLGVGVETFEIDPGQQSGQLDPATTRLTVGLYFPWATDLYLYGRSGIPGQSSQEAGFEYRFNKSFLVKGLRDEEELYHLDLQLNWEF